MRIWSGAASEEDVDSNNLCTRKKTSDKHTHIYT